MTSDGRLPRGADEATLGSALGALLEPLDLGSVDDPDLVELIVLESRQLAHAQSRVWAAMAELSRRDPMPLHGREPLRPDQLLELAADEIRAALMLSRAAARVEMETAAVLAELPTVAEALRTGRIDRRRAMVYAQHCWDLAPEHAAEVVDATLGDAHRVTATGLVDRVRRAAMEADPGWAERRYRNALRDRKVVAYLADDGSAVVVASGLPADQTAAAYANLDAVARAAKRAGADASMDRLRADLFVGLLDQRWNGWTREQLVAELVALHPRRRHSEAGSDAGAEAARADAGHDRRTVVADDSGDPDSVDSDSADPDSLGPGSPNAAAAGAAAHDAAEDMAEDAVEDTVADKSGDLGASTSAVPDAASAEEPSGGTAAAATGVGVSARVEDADDPSSPCEDDACGHGHLGQRRQHGAQRPGDPPPSAPDVGPPRPPVPRPRTGVHVMIGLGTLLGLGDRPGEVAGWGVVPASVARAIVAAQQRCEWRFGVHDDDGWLLFDGITRRRAMPAGADRCDDAATRVDGVVEIHLPSQWLTHAVDRRGLLEGVDPRWRALLADLAAQFAADRRIAQDPGARFPGRPLRRRTQTVFRWCIFPGCRRPARQCQIDHRKDFAKGGATVEENLAPGCAHDHSLKTERGWRLVRTGPRTYCWISPHGRRHHVDVPRLVLPAVTPLAVGTRCPIDDGAEFVGPDDIDAPTLAATYPASTSPTPMPDDGEPPPF